MVLAGLCNLDYWYYVPHILRLGQILGDPPITPSGSLPDSAIAFLPVSPPFVADTTAEGEATAFSLNGSEDGTRTRSFLFIA